MNTLLNTADHLIGKLSSLNRLIDSIAARVLPQQLARAVDCPVVCYERCSGYCGGGFYNLIRYCGHAARDCYADTGYYVKYPCAC